MVIFNSYVKLPEGNWDELMRSYEICHLMIQWALVSAGEGHLDDSMDFEEMNGDHSAHHRPTLPGYPHQP